MCLQDPWQIAKCFDGSENFIFMKENPFFYIFLSSPMENDTQLN